MKKEGYSRLYGATAASPALRASVIWSDRILTKVSYIIYPIFILMMFIKREPDLARYILVPALSFVILSIFRYIYCAPRPYEVFGIPPLIKKDTKGKSFPSRHVFSSFIIALTIMHFNIPSGIILLILGTVMAFSRVAGGVHFIKDVAAGALFAVISYITGFYIV